MVSTPLLGTGIPVYLTPFRIVAAIHPHRGKGFKAVWVNESPRQAYPNNDACAWRETKEAVRMSMANLFADILEVK